MTGASLHVMAWWCGQTCRVQRGRWTQEHLAVLRTTIPTLRGIALSMGPTISTELGAQTNQTARLGLRKCAAAAVPPPAAPPAAPAAVGGEQSMVILRSACDSCHRMKRKCDGSQPCTRCKRRGRGCTYSCKQKSGPPKGSKRKMADVQETPADGRQRPKLMPLAVWPSGHPPARGSKLGMGAGGAAVARAGAKDGVDLKNRPVAGGGLMGTLLKELSKHQESGMLRAGAAAKPL
ncbi:unnamed protein product, partial [Discosporangium mesarthrocarpum]